MAGGVELIVVFWKEQGIQSLVLLSLALQAILLISAEIRQRKDSGVLRVIVWSAYLIADTTAIYALGHMSVSSSSRRRLPENQLVAFWAPFLLLHLGGQDNITAYSIEDNRLWLRHLQNFFVQVFAAAYVLNESSIVGLRTPLRQATILMFVVGVIKYGERVWALKCASRSNLSGKNYQRFGRVSVANSKDLFIIPKRERLVSSAHLLFCFPEHLMKGPLPPVYLEVKVLGDWLEMYQVAEVQLLLMYEVFYSKAPVIHTWYGICIRVFSPVATMAAFLLFYRFSQKDGYNFSRVDVAVTFVLLAGAVVQEVTSVLRAIFSSWAHMGIITFTLLLRRCRRFAHLRSLILGVCSWLLKMIVLPRFVVKYAMRKARLPIRYWSGTMGQHNIIHMCAKSRDSRNSNIARWMGREDWWNRLVYTSAIPVPADFSQLLKKQLLQSVHTSKEDPCHINNSRGRRAMISMGMQEELVWIKDIQLDESILVWHIATHVYLSWYDAKYRGRPVLAISIEVLSNYMVFLLASRPYMLPDNASRQSYIELCNKVVNDLDYSSAEHLTRLIQEHGEALNTAAGPPPDYSRVENLTFDRACQLAAKLIGKEFDRPYDMLDDIAQVWIEMLCYASYRCKADSHARQLSNGGEVATVVAILMEYMNSGLLDVIGVAGFEYP